MIIFLLTCFYLFFILIVSSSNINTCISYVYNFNNACKGQTLEANQPCCLVTSLLNVNGCFCHPYIYNLFGSNFNKITTTLLLQCHQNSQLITWQSWASQYKLDYTIKDCQSFQDFSFHNKQCSFNDMVVETSRANRATSFITHLNDIYDHIESCFDIDYFRKLLSTHLSSQVLLLIKDGGGVFNLLDSVSHFFSLLHPNVNKGMLALTLIPSQTRLKLSSCGTKVFVDTKHELYVSKRQDTSWCYYNPSIQLSWVFEFLECNDKISRIQLLDQNLKEEKNDLNKLLSIFFNSLSYSEDWSLNHFCYAHLFHCHEPNFHFNSLIDCITFAQNLPLVPYTCENKGILVGDTLTCRSKFIYLLPFNPNLYCQVTGTINHIFNNFIHCNDNFQCIQANATLSDSPWFNSDLNLEYKPCLEENKQQFLTYKNGFIC